MSDRARDRTLVLRILVPGLEARLRDKMKECEDKCAETMSSSSHTRSVPGVTSAGSDAATTTTTFMNLDGVTIETTLARNRTLWHFHCDGATYPATLVNLPCPVELHKTHDHVMYYKCVDVSQMLIVYEDEMALEEAQEKPSEGFPSYYPSGLTPPMHMVVERRFKAREHDQKLPPPRVGVAAVEEELVRLMEELNRDEKLKKKPTKMSAASQAHSNARVLEEVTEEVVNYEPWMDDYGRQPQGIEFDADDQICSAHPEVWLRPEDILAIQEDIAAKKRQQEEKKKRQQEAETAAAAKPKKGIASKKNRAESAPQPAIVDDLTLAATSMMAAGDGGDLLGEVDEDFFNDLDLEDEDMNFDNLDAM